MLIRILGMALLICLGCTSALAQPSGANLYALNCAACHGTSGNGGLGVPLALPSFQASISDDYVRQTILRGRPGRVMPAFTHLQADEVDAIVQYVRGWNKKPSVVFSTAPIKGNPRHGQQLFGQYCAGCHGVTGTGGKGTGVTFSRPRDLPIMAPALNNSGFLASAPDAMIKATLMQGREGTPMVSFLKHGLKEKDINDIVSYIRSLEKTAVPASADKSQMEAPVLMRRSPYDLKTTVENIKLAVSNNNFFYGRVQHLEYGFTTPEQENPKQVIVYFCNVSLLNQALLIDPRLGMFLPCRITVLEQADGKVVVMSVNPKLLSTLFNNSELNPLCDQMRQSYVTIMEEATL